MKKIIFILFALFFIVTANAQTGGGSRKSSTPRTKSTSTTSRSAKTGKYVTKDYATKHKSTTYTSKRRK